MSLTLATVLALAPQGPGTSTAPVVINEFSYDDSSTDDLEFVELFNRSANPVDLSGWVIQCIEGTAPGGVNSTYTIASGIIIPAGGYVVIGTAAVPNLTPGTPTAAVNWLENTTSDGIVLFDNASNPVDSVLWATALWTAPFPAYVEGTGLNGRVFANNTVALPTYTTAQRRSDGYDTDNNGADFIYSGASIGAANGSTNSLSLNHVQNCDGAAGTALSSDFWSSFAAPLLADPASITRAIVSSVPQILTIPPSPQGGNVLVMHDPTGGGNSQYLRVPVGEDFLVECYVYVSGGNAALSGTEGEAFAIGVGTTDSYASPADVSGTYYAATSSCAGSGNREPGATGIAWMAYQTTNGTDFYLVDMNDGGPGFTVLGGPITATVGTNDGWQRLRLRVSGNNVVGNFGGTFGADDGQRITATTTTRVAGQVYFQYRECVLANANLLPLVIDNLEVYGVVPFGVTLGGVGSPTNSGTPSIGTAGGDPVLGNAAFQLTCSNMVPNGFGAVAIGLGGLGTGSAIPGAQPGALLYVNPLTTLLTFSDGLGQTAYGLGLPAANALVGLPLAAQWVDFDFTLAFSTPVGTSNGAAIVVGNGN
ncbi:MAG: hypothetical protein RL398_1361 [Planctomycetota bacterium]